MSRWVRKCMRLSLVAGLSMAILYLEHVTGPRTQFRVYFSLLFVFPASLAALWGGKMGGLIYSYTIPIARFGLLLIESTIRLDILTINTTVLILVLAFVVHLTSFNARARELRQKLERYRLLLAARGNRSKPQTQVSPFS